MAFLSENWERAWVLLWSLLGVALAWQVRSLLRFGLERGQQAAGQEPGDR